MKLTEYASKHLIPVEGMSEEMAGGRVTRGQEQDLNKILATISEKLKLSTSLALERYKRWAIAP